MLQVIENCCSSYYLDSMFYHVTQSDRWNMKYPQGKSFDEKHLKIDVIDNEIKEPLLAGLAMGLLMNIYGKRQDLFLPELSFCGISMKDEHRLDNTHTDHDNDPETYFTEEIMTKLEECAAKEFKYATSN